jgi:hypothetical protein
MPEYTIDIIIETDSPLTEAQLFDVAAIGGAATGSPGSRRLETTLTAEGKDLFDASRRAAKRILALAPGKIVAVEATTTEEADRRLNAG